MSILYNVSKKNNQGNEKENDQKGAVLDGATQEELGKDKPQKKRFTLFYSTRLKRTSDEQSLFSWIDIFHSKFSFN